MYPDFRFFPGSREEVAPCASRCSPSTSAAPPGRPRTDRVPATIAGLAESGCTPPFERTAGDEFQGVARDPAVLAAVVERLLRDDAWSIGIGIGEVDAARCRRAPGPVAGRPTVHAREAVTAAKSAPWRLRVVGDDPGVRSLETTLWLWAARPGPAHVAGLGGRRPGRRRRVVRRGREAARYHPVRGQPARPGGRHRRGPAGPRAGHRARRWSPAGSRSDERRQHHPARAGPARRRPGRRRLSAGRRTAGRSGPPLALLALAAAAVRRSGRRRARATGSRTTTVLVALAGLLAVVGGGPLTTRIFAIVDRADQTSQASRPASPASPAGPTERPSTRPAGCSGAAPGSVRWSGSRSSPGSRPGSPRASRWCWRSRAWAASRTSAADGGSGGRNRAVHHRHLRQRALGRGLRGHGRAGAALTQRTHVRFASHPPAWCRSDEHSPGHEPRESHVTTPDGHGRERAACMPVSSSSHAFESHSTAQSSCRTRQRVLDGPRVLERHVRRVLRLRARLGAGAHRHAREAPEPPRTGQQPRREPVPPAAVVEHRETAHAGGVGHPDSHSPHPAVPGYIDGLTTGT